MKFNKHFPAAILAFLFLFGGLSFFFPLVPVPPMTGNSLTFFNLLGTTDYMVVVKILEIIGGALIILPRKRALATLILAPISVNIFLFEICMIGTPGISILLIALIGLVVYQEKQKFMALV
jgi:putative oxidoreductase